MNWLLISYSADSEGKLVELLPGLAPDFEKAMAAAESLVKDGLAHGNIRVSHVVLYRKRPGSWVQDITVVAPKA